jgi:hypothetical protein
MEPQDNFWGVDLPDEGETSKKDMRAFLSLLSDSSNADWNCRPLPHPKK